MEERFIVPPFSVLDSKQGYWNERKRKWKSEGIESGAGRDDDLVFDVRADYIKKTDSQTSIFDPVLCEIMYKWFCVDGGSIYDCFAGGSVRGIIADRLGYKYTGIELREEQVKENEKQADKIGAFPTWICDDSQNADKYINDESADMIFTCPPYADLEVYSDDARDISNMGYNDFCKVYKNILSIACRKLKENRFAVIVVGDVRDKEGVYHQLVDYTRKILTDNGLKLYNDLILAEPLGSAPIRAPRTFNSSRKIIKVHQNVLVFYKGDIKQISENYKEINFDEVEKP